MNNDLISREDLKKALESPCWTKWEWKFICECIDNAPTVYPICEDKACKYRANERPHGQCIKCGRETSGVVSIFDNNDNLTQKVYLCSECWENNEPFEPVKFTDDIAADMSRLKAENNRLTAEIERVYELYNGAIASKQEQPRKGCPFGDQRETCAEFRANGCDLCKFATS